MKDLKEGIDMKVLKDVLKDVFLHGATQADMSVFPVKSNDDVIVSYDKHSMIHLLKVCYVKCYHNESRFVSNDYYFFTYGEAYNWYMRYMSYLDTLYARGIIPDYMVHCERIY